MYIKGLIFCIIFFLFSVNFVFSQTEEIISIQWDENRILTEGNKSISVPVIIGQDFIGQIPNYFWQKKVESNISFDVEAELLSTIPATDLDQVYLNSNYIDVNDFDPSFSRAVRNLIGVDMLLEQGTNVYDILRKESLIITKSALERLEVRLK